MTLSPGTELLHYRLVEKIGEGAMGVVWRALDTSLERDVAIKLLPDQFARSPDRLARFQREAKMLAALNHPNIAAVYGQHEADGVRFIAMELVRGETLDTMIDRTGRAGLAIEDALRIGRQIAEGLESAHDQGIVHRDLKPANVKIRPDGTVKVLDFGLARAIANDLPPESGSSAPTITADLTKMGTVLGTAPYMSPEQARGKAVDKRTDIWSLGCVLVECLSGRRPFVGATTTDILSAVISKEPDLDALPPELPSSIGELLRRCLVKDPNRRLRDAGEVRLAIEELDADTFADSAGRSGDDAPRDARKSQLLPWGLVGVLTIALAASLLNSEDPVTTTHAEVSRWAIRLPSESRVELPGPGGKFNYSRLVAISPNGRRVVYSGKRGEGQADLYLRDFISGVTKLIPGTSDGRAPFFSPDGEWLAFYAVTSLYKVAVTGGSPLKICDVGRMISFDGSWSPDGREIIFATDEGLWQVAAAGGTPEALTTPNQEKGEVGHHVPRYTLDGSGVLFTVTATPEMHLALLSLDTNRWEIILRNASQGIVLTSKSLVFARAGEIFLTSLGAGFKVLSGSTVSVVQGVHTSPGLGGMVLNHFDVANSGALAFVPRVVSQTEDQLLWVDSEGNESVITAGAGTWVHPRLSPNGQRISVDIHSPDGMRDVYIYEIQRGQLNRLTRTGISWESEWRPDGQRIATLSGAPAGHWSLFWIKTDFSDPAELLYRSGHAVPLSWLPDGSAFLFSKHRFDGGIWKLSTTGEAEPELVKATAARERFASLSPNGKWIAFVADESGRREVFVRSFPNQGPMYKISIEGGGEPVWSRDGSKLYLRERDQMFSAGITYAPSFSASRPELLFTARYDAAAVGHQHYDVALDSERFLMIKHGESVGPHEVRVVLNWVDELGGAEYPAR